MHARADIGSPEVDMGSHERTVIGLESRAATKHFVTISRKTRNNTEYIVGIRINLFCLTTCIEF